MGSGTTAIVAEELKRQWIGFDIDQKYIEITQNRINKSVPVQEVAQQAQNPLADALY